MKEEIKISFTVTAKPQELISYCTCIAHHGFSQLRSKTKPQPWRVAPETEIPLHAVSNITCLGLGCERMGYYSIHPPPPLSAYTWPPPPPPASAATAGCISTPLVCAYLHTHTRSRVKADGSRAVRCKNFFLKKYIYCRFIHMEMRVFNHVAVS